MTNLHQASHKACSRDHEYNAEPSYSAHNPRKLSTQLLMTASNQDKPILSRSNTMTISSGPCQMCTDLHRQIRSIAYGLHGLLAAVQDAMWSEHLKSLINQEFESRKSRLEHAMNTPHQLIPWILESIEFTASFLSMADVDSPSRPGGNSCTEKRMQASSIAKRKSYFLDEERKPSPLPSMSHRSDSESREGSSNCFSDEFSDDPPTSHSTNSVSENIPRSSKSNLQFSPESRILPSPLRSSSSLQSLSPTVLAGSTAHMANLQDLQNQIGAKTLAYEALQREHQSLLSAFTRSQKRVEVLDKKSHDTGIEVRDLHHGRVKLEAQIESLEDQVGEIQHCRDDEHAQSIAKDAQYMHIMTMSTKLEAQGASASQIWKAERDKWELERKAFTRQIIALENEKSALLRRLGGDGRIEFADTSSHVLSTTKAAEIPASHQKLQQEVEELRINCKKMRSALQALYQESSHFNEAFDKIGGMGKRLQNQLRETQSHLSPLPGEEDLDMISVENSVSSG